MSMSPTRLHSMSLGFQILVLIMSASNSFFIKTFEYFFCGRHFTFFDNTLFCGKTFSHKKCNTTMSFAAKSEISVAEKKHLSKFFFDKRVLGTTKD